MTNTFFSSSGKPYIYMQLAAERYLSQPAMLKSQSVQKMFRSRICTVTSLWLNVYILCSEQKNASQKPSVVVYNIGCQKGFIQLEVLEMYKITVAYIYTVSTSQEKSQTEHPFCLIHSPAFACSLYIIYLSTIRIQSNKLPSPSSLCNMLKSPIYPFSVSKLQKNIEKKVYRSLKNLLIFKYKIGSLKKYKSNLIKYTDRNLLCA